MTISEYNMIEYISEATNNYDKTCERIQKHGSVDLGCVYCVKIYKCFSRNSIRVGSLNTIVCNTCKVDAVIPIIPTSILSTECNTYDKRIKKLQEWNTIGFTELVDDEEEYIDYEYHDCIDIHNDVDDSDMK